MYDVVGDLGNLDSDTSDYLPCVVFEWLDFTLTEVPSQDYRQNCVFLKAIVKAGLSSLVALLKEGLMNTGRKITMEGLIFADELRSEARQHPTLQDR